MISKFNVDASQFKNQFAGKEITSKFINILLTNVIEPLEYLNNFE